MQKIGSEGLDAKTQDNIEHPRGHQTAEGGRNTPGLNPVYDRGDEGEGGGQENRHHALGEQLEHQGAHAGGEKGHIRIEPRQKRNQNQRTEGHKHHLGTDDTVFQSEVISGGRSLRGHKTSSCSGLKANRHSIQPV